MQLSVPLRARTLADHAYQSRLLDGFGNKVNRGGCANELVGPVKAEASVGESGSTLTAEHPLQRAPPQPGHRFPSAWDLRRERWT